MLKVLIATHHYFDLTGSETFASTLARALVLKGCKVTMYSPYIGGIITEKTRGLGIPVYNSLEAIRDEEFDVIHLSHNLVAIEVRLYFPGTPILFLSHGVIPFLEQPPLENLNISKYLAVSEEVKDNLLRKGIREKDIMIFRNIIDTDRFYPYGAINPRPKKLLINSRRIDQQTLSIIEEACKRLSLQIAFIGNSGNVHENVEEYINQADICISLGRGILEAMSCGRAAVVFDYNGGDGLVTISNIDEIQKCNFSGRRFRRWLGVETLVEEIQKYKQNMGLTNRKIIEQRFSASQNVDSLIKTYEEAISHFRRRPIKSNGLKKFMNSIIETRIYSSEIQSRNFEQALRERETYIGSLEDGIKEKDATIENLEISIRGREGQIVNLENTLKDKDAHISNIQGLLKNREAEVEDLRTNLSDKEKQLFNFNETVAQRNTQISRLEGLVREKESALVSFQSALQERDQNISRLETIVKENETKIRRLNEALSRRDSRVLELTNSLSERDVHISHLEPLVSEKEEEVEGLRAGLAEKEREIGTLVERLSLRESEISELTAAISEKQAQISHFESLVKEKESTLASFQSALEERDQNISRLEAIVKENETRIGRLNEAVSRRDSRLLELTAALSERDVHISHLEPLVSEKEVEIGNLQDTISQKANHISHLEGVVWKKDAALKHISNSHGWKALLTYYRVRDKILPVDSRRRKAAKFIWNFSDNVSLKSVRLITKQNVKRSVHYIRTYGIRSFFKKIWSKINPEKPGISCKPMVPKLNLPVIKEDVILAYEDARVSVVIPVFNEATNLEILLPFLKNQKGLKEIEIILVDSGSTDQSVAIAETHSAKIVNIPNQNFSHDYARNLGAEHSSGKYILFLTADALPSSDTWLYEMLYALRNNDTVAVSCVEHPRMDADLFWRVNLWNHNKFLEVNKGDRILSMPEVANYTNLRKNAQLANVACLIDRDIFLKYKFRIQYAEDLDLGVRLIKDGYKLALLSSTVVIHSHNRPAYHHLKRGYVDSLILTQILPDFPLSFIQANDLITDIVFTYDVLNSLVINRLDDIGTPCNVDRLRDVVVSELESTDNRISPTSVKFKDNNYTDKQFRLFIQKIYASYSKIQDNQKYHGCLIDAMLDYLGQITHEYMTNIYESIDNGVLEDYKHLVLKAFAFQAGVYLAGGYLRSSGGEKAKLQDFHDELSDVRILWEQKHNVK